MQRTRSSHPTRNIFFRLVSAAKKHRQQIGVVIVAVTLGMVIVLNVAMAPWTGHRDSKAQVTYLEGEAPETRSVIQ